MQKKSLGIKGLTLLEVLVALAIMTVTFGSIIAIQQSAMRATEIAKRMDTLTILARNQMTELEFKIEGKQFTEIKAIDSGQFEEPFSDYRWKSEIKEIALPNLMSLALGGSTQNTNITQIISTMMNQYFKKSLREIILTIFWTQGSHERSVQVSSFWIDLTHELQIQF